MGYPAQFVGENVVDRFPVIEVSDAPYPAGIHGQPTNIFRHRCKTPEYLGCHEYAPVVHVYLPMTRRAPFFTLLLVAANIASYALELASGGQATCEAYGLVPARFMRTGALEPLFSSLFLHDPGSLIHLGGNMAFLVLFGVIVEQALGHLSFLGVYLLAGAAGGLLHVAVGPSATEPLVGASGAIFGLIAVAGVLRPRLMGFVAAFVGLNIWHAFTGSDGNVSFGCHIGGFCVGFLVVLLLKACDSEVLEVA